MALSMQYFMKEELKKDEIVEIPGIDTFKDNDGNIIPFKVKILGTEEIAKIRKMYTTNKLLIDDKGRKVFDKNGKPIYETEVDNLKANQRLLVESLVYPNLKDDELMKYYGCVDALDMPYKVFKKMDDYKKVTSSVIEALGLNNDLDDEELIEEAKN